MDIHQMNIVSLCRLIMELCNIVIVPFSYHNYFLCFIFLPRVSFVHYIKHALFYLFYELYSKGKLIDRLVQKFFDSECLTHCL